MKPEAFLSDRAVLSETLPPARAKSTLPRFGKDWRARWLYLEKGSMLHRVAAITWADDDYINGHGGTACGQFGFMWMPGFGGRMGAKRCPSCCDGAGVPRGTGAPFNQGIDQ